MAIYLSCSIALITNYMHKIERTSIGAISVIRQNSVSMRRLFWLKQDAQLSQGDHAAGCVIVFAESRRLELGDNILRTL